MFGTQTVDQFTVKLNLINRLLCVIVILLYLCVNTQMRQD